MEAGISVWVRPSLENTFYLAGEVVLAFERTSLSELLTRLGSSNVFECLGFFVQIARVTVSGFGIEGVQQGVPDA
jgi:hypothetical protein